MEEYTHSVPRINYLESLAIMKQQGERREMNKGHRMNKEKFINACLYINKLKGDVG